MGHRSSSAALKCIIVGPSVRHPSYSALIRCRLFDNISLLCIVSRWWCGCHIIVYYNNYVFVARRAFAARDLHWIGSIHHFGKWQQQQQPCWCHCCDHIIAARCCRLAICARHCQKKTKCAKGKQRQCQRLHRTVWYNKHPPPYTAKPNGGGNYKSTGSHLFLSIRYAYIWTTLYYSQQILGHSGFYVVQHYSSIILSFLSFKKKTLVSFRLIVSEHWFRIFGLSHLRIYFRIITNIVSAHSIDCVGFQSRWITVPIFNWMNPFNLTNNSLTRNSPILIENRQ